MEKVVFNNLLKEINKGLKLNKKIIDQALNKEMSKGNTVRLERITNILKDFENIEGKNEAQSIAVCYSGAPEITVTYILDSILYNNKITLCVNEYKIINEVLITIIVESMKKLNIKNLWINYSSSYNEIYLRDNEKNFDKIVYIGDYFEYERFKYFFKKDVEYNNYGYIKLFMDKSKFKNEYKEIYGEDLSFYEFRKSISVYAVSKNADGNFIYDETIAEAFHDTYLNGDNAKAASKYIVKVLKDKLKG